MTILNGKIPRTLLSDRPIRVGFARAAPLLRIESDWLIADATKRTKHRASRNLLSDFLEARDSQDKLARFCRRWGVLGLCEHGIPRKYGNCRYGLESCSTQYDVFTSDSEGGRPVYRESSRSLLKFANALSALLSIGFEIAQERPGSPEDWKTVAAIFADYLPEFSERSPSIRAARVRLGIFMTRLIDACQIRPQFHWDDSLNTWRIELDSEVSVSNVSNIPALMVLELTLTVADMDGLAVCSSCRRLYSPERRPDPARRNYCSVCGKTAAMRYAAREYRKRLRERKEHGKETRKR